MKQKFDNNILAPVNVVKPAKKVKDPLESIFGKGKRLPVFTVITYSSKDATKKKNKAKKQAKAKKEHKFNKQNSEKITNTQALDNLLFSSTTQASRRTNKKKIVLAEDKASMN